MGSCGLRWWLPYPLCKCGESQTIGLPALRSQGAGPTWPSPAMPIVRAVHNFCLRVSPPAGRNPAPAVYGETRFMFGDQRTLMYMGFLASAGKAGCGAAAHGGYHRDRPEPSTSTERIGIRPARSRRLELNEPASRGPPEARAPEPPSISALGSSFGGCVYPVPFRDHAPAGAVTWYPSVTRSIK